MIRNRHLPRHAETAPTTAEVEGPVGESLCRSPGKGLVRLAAGAAIVLLNCIALPAADEPKNEEVVRQRLEFMTRKLDGFVLSTERSPDKRLVRTKEPVLRFSNPARTVLTDGAVFVWHSEGRPMAVCGLWIGAEGGVHREFTSLSDQPLQCVRDGKVVWSPRSGSFAVKPLPGAPKPVATPALRLAQMRRLAERFSGTFEVKSARGPEELRLMPQPLYRHTADKGVVEGAIFALAHANDPEVLVVLQLTSPALNAPAWSYGLARMSTARLRVNLDEKEVWSVEPYWSNPRSPDDPYQEAGDGKFLGTDPMRPAAKGM